MKRYYLDKLNVFQSLIKAIIICILITMFLGILFLMTSLVMDIFYLYALGVIYIVIFIIVISKGFLSLSFYINDNAIIYCNGKKETKIKLHSITKLEEYFGIDYLFNKKTIIIHANNKRYNFIFSKDRAEIFKNQLEDYINDVEEFGDFNL